MKTYLIKSHYNVITEGKTNIVQNSLKRETVQKICISFLGHIVEEKLCGGAIANSHTHQLFRLLINSLPTCFLHFSTAFKDLQQETRFWRPKENM